MSTARISPTAHYTGAVWARRGLGHPAVQGGASPMLYRLTSPALGLLSRVLGSQTLDDALEQRHRGIDALLAAEIAAHGTAQVLEVPGGLSCRGPRFLDRYPTLRWVEGDLPGMAERKRACLQADAYPSDRHAVVAMDVLTDDGPHALARVAGAHLDPEAPVVIITEGLFNYFDEAQVRGTLRRMLAAFARAPRVRFLADMLVRDPDPPREVRVFLHGLGVFARGRVAAHFDGPEAAVAELRAAGFDEARVLPALADPEAPPTGGVPLSLLDAVRA